MKKNFLAILVTSIVIILIGLIVVIAAGFNVSDGYRAHKNIRLSMGESYNLSDVQSIADEVFGKGKARLSKAGLYDDEFEINVYEVSDEQINVIKEKINQKYNINQKLYIKIGDDYSVDDIKTIAAEVLKKDDLAVEKFKDDETYVAIEANVVTEKDLDELNNKINEKYSLSNKTEAMGVSNVIKSVDMPRVRLSDIAKQYVMYTLIATGIVLLYFMIRYRKMGVLKVLINCIAHIALAELLYMSIIVIIRVPIDKTVIISLFAIYIAIVTYLNNKFLKLSEKK